VLRDKQNHTIPLTGAEVSLYGTKLTQGTELTIKPGEWVAAFVNFKVEDLYNITSPSEFPLGESRLFVEWQQASRTWDRLKCGWGSTYFDNRDYTQEHPELVVQVSRTGSSNSE